MLKDFLKQLQELQFAAWEAGINMEISTRDVNSDDPWIIGYVNVEGCDFVEDKEGTTYINFHLHPYTWRTKMQNTLALKCEMSRIGDFINNHKTIEK